MKPLWLEIEGYKSYREKQRVDFEALGRDGLFGIFGRTGSGKSSILDAVIFALFGGGRDLGSLINSVCKSARVSFAFNMLTADGRKTFEASRGITRNKDGSVNTSECRFIRYDGSHPVVLASDRTEQMNEAVRSVLKLDKEEFSKTVVLPQGQFADFLRLGSAARNDILEKIFMLDKYGTLLESRAKQEKEVLKERSIQMGQIIQECAYAADAELARQKEAVSAGKAAGEMLEKQAKDAEAFFTVMTEAYKNTCELETLLARAGELAQQAGEMTKIKAACLQAEKAERALPFIKAYSEAKMACDKAAGEKERLQKSFLPAEERMKAASAMFETAEKNRGENMKLGQLSVALEDYIKLQVNAENIKKEAEKARGFAAALQIEFEQADTRAKKLETGLNKLKEKNYAIFAASRLEEGMPCPVCGSTSHPDKAEGAMLDARALELQANEAKETAEGVRKRLDEARGKVEGLLGKAHEAGNNMDAVLSRLAGLSPEAKTLDPDRARAILEGTRRRLKQITEDFSAASNEKDNAEKVFNTLKQQLAAAENAEKIYTAGLKKAET
ncbi:MAG: SMC family ATPase, partial [Bacillota bacterium]|nr:SMC family ATPase [Bacillota bacterium]